MKIELTKTETQAVLWAVGQHTQSNGFYVEEIMREGLTRKEAKALICAYHKIAQKTYHAKR